MNAALIACGALLNLIGSFAYIRDTLHGTTKPNRVTWLLWSIAPMIAFAASFTSGITWATVPVFMSGFCPFLIFLASFVNRNAYWQLTRFDYACGFFSVLALALWAMTSDPLVAIFFAMIADFAAGYPTLVKAWGYPDTETLSAYVLAMISLTPAFIVATPSLAAYAFPTYLLCMNGLIVFAILRGRFKRVS